MGTARARKGYMAAEHSALPWRVQNTPSVNTHMVYSADGHYLGHFWNLDRHDLVGANATFVVHAANSHEALVAAAKLTILMFQRQQCQRERFLGDDEHEAWSALTRAVQQAEGREGA